MITRFIDGNSYDVLKRSSDAREGSQISTGDFYLSLRGLGHCYPEMSSALETYGIDLGTFDDLVWRINRHSVAENPVRDSKLVLQRAFEYANEQCSKPITPNHLLVGVLSIETGVVARTLQALGVPREGLLEKIRQTKAAAA